MNIIVEVKNHEGKIEGITLRRGYLTKFVDPKKLYPVSYYINNDRARISKIAEVKGEDLSENQIAELFSRELL